MPCLILQGTVQAEICEGVLDALTFGPTQVAHFIDKKDLFIFFNIILFSKNLFLLEYFLKYKEFILTYNKMHCHK